MLLNKPYSAFWLVNEIRYKNKLDILWKISFSIYKNKDRNKYILKKRRKTIKIYNEIGTSSLFFSQDMPLYWTIFG